MNNNTFQVKKEASSNDSIEALSLTMQRMELNVLKVVGTLSERVNAMENKLDSLLQNVNNMERNTSNTLANTVNGLASHLEKAHAASHEKQLSHIAEVQTLTQIITALRQNPNAFGPIPGGVPIMQQPQHQQSTFRPVHPNLQAAPSIPQNIQQPLQQQHLPMEPRPAAIPTESKPFPVIKPPVAPEISDKKDSEPGFKANPFTANTGNFNFGTGQPQQQQSQKPLFPEKPALPTAAVGESPAKPAETKSIFGSTGAAAKPPFSFATPSAGTTPVNPFAAASPQAAPAGANQQKSLFGSPFATAPNNATTGNFNNKPLSFAPANNSTTTPTNIASPFAPKDAHDEGENENPEEYVPDAHYEPVIPLPDKVDVVTGEESEQVLFKDRCKLYIFNSESKDVKERGVGDIKILFHPEKKSYRVVMRREQVHKICANFRITKGMNVADKTGTKNCGIFNCIDFSENTENGTSTVFFVRFRDEVVYGEFKKLFNDIADGRRTEGGAATVPQQPKKEAVKEASLPKEKAAVPVVEAKKEPEVKGFGDKFNKKEGEWDCTTCYVVNKPSDAACVSCGTGKDGTEKSAAAPAFKPQTFAPAANTSFSFGITNAQKPLFGATPAAPSPAKTEAPSTESKPAESKSLFGTTKPITFSFAPPQSATPTSSPFATPATGSPFGAKTDGTQTKSLFGGSNSSSANKTPLSFSSFASGTSFLDKKTDSPNNSFGAIGSSTFAKNANAAAAAEEESENPEEYVPDAHYEPVIPLPDKVDVVTGEESEQVLFKNRCKLYIYSESKEVKERGVGDIKILHDPSKKTYRVVMRREQVHKICANFRITQGMNIADKAGSKGVGIFSCMDFSENTQSGTSTVFYVRFREETVYDEFKKLFNDIAAGKPTPAVAAATTSAESTPSVTATTTNKPSPKTATVPSLPYIGDSHNPSVDAEEEEEDYDEDYGEENYDEESEVLLETDCKVTLGEAYKSPLSKNKNPDEVHNHVKLIVAVADEGVYKVEFDNGKGEPIFPHFIQNDSDYKKDGKKISFIARDHSAVRKSVTCEFKDAATAEKTFETLQECRDSTNFDGYDD